MKTTKLVALLLFFIVLTIKSNELDESSITMPWGDFKELLQKADDYNTQDQSDNDTVVHYTISSAHYYGKKINEREVQFTATLSIVVLSKKSKWVDIPLNSMMAITPPVLVNGKHASVKIDDEQLVLLTNKSGVHTVRYTFTVPIIQELDKIAIIFPLPAIQSISSVTFDMGDENHTLKLNSHDMVPHKQKKFHYVGNMGSAEKVRLLIEPKVSTYYAEEARSSASVYTRYVVGNSALKFISQVNLEMYHKVDNKSSLTLPKSVKNISVEGEYVHQWNMIEGEKFNTITVYLKKVQKGKSNFIVKGEQSFLDTLKNVTIPEITIENVDQQEGFLTIEGVQNVELALLQYSNNIILKDKRELPSWFNKSDNVFYTFHYLSQGYDILLDVNSHPMIQTVGTIIERGEYKSVLRSDGKIITSLTLSVKNREEQYLSMEWEKKHQLWSIYCNGEPVKPILDTIHKKLLIPLQKGSDYAATTSIDLVYLTMGKPFGIMNEQTITYPTLNIPQQNISYNLYLPKEYRYFKYDGNIHLDKIYGEDKLFHSSYYSLLFDKNNPYDLEGYYTGGGGDYFRRYSRDRKPRGSAVMSGRTASSEDLFGKGGFAYGIDSILQGVGGLQSSTSRGTGRKNSAGIGFGGGSGGVDKLLGDLMSDDGGTLKLKKRGELKIQKPVFTRGGSLTGGRNRASIMGVVRQNFAAIRYAYNKRLRDRPDLAGRITVKFAIDEFGKVIYAQVQNSTMNDSKMENMVLSKVRRWQFGKIDKQGDVTEVVYPFVFSTGSTGSQTRTNVAKRKPSRHIKKVTHTTGALSIPVRVNYDGQEVAFYTRLLQSDEVPKLTFHYSKDYYSESLLLSIVYYGLLVILSICLFHLLWSGWSKNIFIYGVVIPILLIILMVLLLGAIFSPDVIVTILIMLFMWKIGVGIFLKRKKSTEVISKE